MVLLLSPAGQRDKPHIPQLAMSPQFTGHVQATYDRQAQVEQNNIGSVRQSRRDRGMPIERSPYFVPHPFDSQFQHLH